MKNDLHPYTPMSQILSSLQSGKVVIVLDEEDRENEGDFIVAAEFVDPESINFMISEGKGLLCQVLTEKRVHEIGLTPMLAEDTSGPKRSINGTNFMISVDAVDCIGAGVSAQDRSITTHKLIEKGVEAKKDFYCPGHCFPLQSVKKGLQERMGHTESVIDLMLLADLYPSGLLCEILNLDGTMARLTDIIKISKKENIAVTHVYQILEEIQNRGGRDQLIANSKYKSLYS